MCQQWYNLRILNKFKISFKLKNFFKALIEKISKSGSAFFMAGMLPLFSVTLFVKRTVNELLTGYDDPLLNLGKFANPKQVKTSKFSLMNDVIFILVF